MLKEKAIQSVKFVKENSSKRNFKQSFDLILNLKDINLKKTEEQVSTFVTLHYGRGKSVKICGLVGPELATQAKEAFENVVLADDFVKYAQDKKALKKLANEYDFFVAQANIMAQVAANFGKVLGPRGKMPNPKVGCVVPPNANLRPLSERLHKIVKLEAKTAPIIQVGVGKEDMKEDEIADNITTIYNSLIHVLPKEGNNIKNILLKLTMGKAFVLDDKGQIVKKEEPKKETESKKVKPKKEELKAEVTEEKVSEPEKKRPKKEKAN